MYSAGEWSLPPIGPRPSSEGIPSRGRVRVGRPPVEVSLTSNPRRSRARPLVDERPDRSSFSIGHQRAMSVISAVVSGTARAVSRSRIAASAASRSSRRTARTSTSSSQRSATTLGRVPPATTPTLNVTPGQRPFSPWIRWTRSAAARIALRPFSGSTPAWAARPWTVIFASRMPFRDETMSPFARAHSRTRQASASAASSRMWGVDVSEPISRRGSRRTSGLQGSVPAAATARTA